MASGRKFVKYGVSGEGGGLDSVGRGCVGTGKGRFRGLKDNGLETEPREQAGVRTCAPGALSDPDPASGLRATNALVKRVASNQLVLSVDRDMCMATGAVFMNDGLSRGGIGLFEY